MSRQKRKTPAPRLRVSPNAETLLRTMLATCDTAKLRAMAADPAGRSELSRLQRIAAARVEEFEGYLQLARDAETMFSTALNTTLEA
ncbi:hypothetical protein [Stenotrophomonas sp.]|uniref:hypothetical protein n=1 Tax=Stenotrophomonas sp. TaxID=69392 RepID=UPI0019AD21C4|nr:hypothetical protein [Stenotrophomonas sp.]MBD3827299.1 hypothetical protein [Stenotrophomonas sp.]